MSSTNNSSSNTIIKVALAAASGTVQLTVKVKIIVVTFEYFDVHFSSFSIKMSPSRRHHKLWKLWQIRGGRFDVTVLLCWLLNFPSWLILLIFYWEGNLQVPSHRLRWFSGRLFDWRRLISIMIPSRTFLLEVHQTKW